MKKLGIPTCYIRWLKSFLNDRRSNVRFGDCHSNKRRFRNGLPQGSVLAPLLFLIYYQRY